ncbi:CCA tRNA nucleotidyltransferase [Clostridium uliginosum]|uniref:tRNA nucleotidyltransferase (CCA-adding enzyme) n=1 Tax=Clostridium uliginosum TaxID=119641 RepID=A0A1I1HDX3_9CLOT|nr:CCA tRNA nucleotidyltransferase [Clostridium uliginosum]SFC22197.1 tRNA nucleotidyltransferase (CCA-adding enzyme) [Clostridium uliginosum]
MNFKINIPKDVKLVLDTLINNGYEAYIVGGCVRDSVLGKSPKDWDITTKAKPDEVIELFKKVILTGIKHGTVTVMIGKEGYEVTTYRNDGEYEDNRHPKQVEFVSNLKEDLARRDFSINAMAYNEQDGLVDYFNGVEDLKSKIIKTVGEPKKRFCEDALRMLRAIRFSAQLDFDISNDTLLSIRTLKDNIKNISKERIREEFNKMLVSNTKSIEVLKETGLLEYIIPYINKTYDFEQNNPYHIYNLYEHTLLSTKLIENKLYLKLTMLLHDLGKLKTKTSDENNISHFYGHAKESVLMAEKALKDLKYDNDTINKVTTLIKYHDSTLKTKLSVKRMLNKIGEDLLRDLIKVQRADVLAQNPIYEKDRILNLVNVENKLNDIIEQSECVNLKDLEINGQDLINIGFNKGKEIGQILNYLLDLVIETPNLNNKEILLKIAKNKLMS